jgi:hypothetical protein
MRDGNAAAMVRKQYRSTAIEDGCVEVTSCDQFPFTTESSGLGGNETSDGWRSRRGEAWLRS